MLSLENRLGIFAGDSFVSAGSVIVVVVVTAGVAMNVTMAR